MFADDDSHDSFIPATEPSTILSTADLALPSVHAGVAATLAEIHLSTTPHDAYRATRKSDPTIKIPSPVDRLALRLLSSCNVSEQTEEDKDVVSSLITKSNVLDLAERSDKPFDYGAVHS
jgi:hypothetical protein